MNLLLLAAHERGIIRLQDRRADHLLRVLRVIPGSRVRAGIIGGATAQVEVCATDQDSVVLQVEIDGEPPPRPPVELILAVPRPKAARRTLQTIGTLGVGKLELVNAWRVEKAYFQSPALQADAIKQQLLLGCEQGATTWLPECRVHPMLMPFLRDEFAPPDNAVRLLPHPRAQHSLEQVAPRDGRPVVAALGPEGGWIEREVASFEELGFVPVRLSEAVLRVETAVAVLLGQLELLRRLGSGG